MATTFPGNDFWYRFGGQALVMIVQYCQQETFTISGYVSNKHTQKSDPLPSKLKEWQLTPNCL